VFVSPDSAVQGLAYAGFNAVTVANNHADGPGIPAFLDMLQKLHSAGIATCVGGDNLAAARKPAIISAKGVRIALLGYDLVSPQGPFATDTTGGITPYDPETIQGDITSARWVADLVIPYFHWGIEYTSVPTYQQQAAAHAAIRAGADMVLGNHPHWVQGIEEYEGKLIIYSMGNFVFDQFWSRPTMEGVMLHMYWRNNTLSSIRFVPVLDENLCQPNLITESDATDIFSRIWSATDQLAGGSYGP